MDWEELLKQQKQIDDVLAIVEKNAMQVLASIKKAQEEIKNGLAQYQLNNATKLKSLSDILESIGTSLGQINQKK